MKMNLCVILYQKLTLDSIGGIVSDDGNNTWHILAAPFIFPIAIFLFVKCNPTNKKIWPYVSLPLQIV